MRKLAAIFCLSAILIAAAGQVAAAPRGWIHLGDRKVNDRLDHDVFNLKGPERELSAIKITVKKRPVEIRRVRITFADGATQELTIDRVIQPGDWSRPLDLVGGRRIVTRVEFWYDTQSAGKRAVVRLFGLRV